jgi:hypothetical protein
MNASVHRAGCVTRSFFSHSYSGVPGPQPLSIAGLVVIGARWPSSGVHVEPLHSCEFSAMRCHEPRSNEYPTARRMRPVAEVAVVTLGVERVRLVVPRDGMRDVLQVGEVPVVVRDEVLVRTVQVLQITQCEERVGRHLADRLRHAVVATTALVVAGQRLARDVADRGDHWTRGLSRFDRGGIAAGGHNKPEREHARHHSMHWFPPSGWSGDCIPNRIDGSTRGEAVDEDAES